MSGLIRIDKRQAVRVGLLGLLVVALCATGWLLLHYRLIDGSFYSVDTERLNLSGSDIRDLSPLKGMARLRRLDLTHTRAENLSALDGCRALRLVRMRDKTLPAETCAAFYLKHPKARLECRVRLGGQTYAYDIQELKAEDLPSDQIRQLAVLRDLRALDLTYCDVSDEDYDYLAEQLPDCEIRRMVTFNDKDYRSDVESVRMTGAPSEDEIDRLRFFPHLQLVDVTGLTDRDLIEVLREKFPGVSIRWSIAVLGKSFASTDRTIVLTGKGRSLDKLKEELRAKKDLFVQLEAVDLCGCGFTNEQMEDLCRMFPDLKFIWYVYVGDYPVRTDAKVLSLSFTKISYNETALRDVCRYCTDLVALDVADKNLQNLTKFGGLKKLRALRISHSQLKSLQGLEAFPDLEYLEADCNYLSDIGSLAGLQKLRYVNVHGRPGSGYVVEDISPLLDHPLLELAVFDGLVKTAQRKTFAKSNPACRTVYGFYSDGARAIPEAWAKLSYREELEKAFRDWRHVTDYDEDSGTFVIDQKSKQYQR